MSRAKRVEDGDGVFVGLRIDCPGCGDHHMLPVRGTASQYYAGRASWDWNGSMDLPTFSPSLLVRSGHYAPHHDPARGCWCTYNAEHADDRAPYACGVCHSFIRDGRIQFLDDCTHALAGTTVDLPEIQEDAA